MKTFLIALVGLACVADAKMPHTKALMEERRFDNQGKLAAIKEEGEIFTEDSDKPRSEDSMWWINIFWKFMVDIYYGVSIKQNAVLGTTDGLNAAYNIYPGFWAEAKLYATTEIAEWYLHTFAPKLYLAEVFPIFRVSVPTAPFNAGFNADYCFWLGWELNLLDLVTKIW